MSNNMKYSDYEDMYPETVIIRKEGYFFNIRGQGAVVCHGLFDYTCWKADDGSISMGVGEKSVPVICEKLSEKSISYFVLIRGEIVAGESFDNNAFNEYLDTDISDVQFREFKRGKKTLNKILSDEENKLCDISIKYFERLLDGHHPVDNSIIENDTVLKDENVQRCFLFVVDVLKRLSNQNDQKREKKIIKEKELSKPEREKIISEMIQERDVKMSEMQGLITPFLHDLFENETVKVSSYKISNWLKDNGYLHSVLDNKGNNHREATEKGESIGIINRVVDNGFDSYVQYLFTPKGQRYVYENLKEIAEYKKKK